MLHFHGKSSWDGGESIDEIKVRDRKYTEVFLEKWGDDMTKIFILRNNFSEIIEKKGLSELFKKGKFGDLIRKLS